MYSQYYFLEGVNLTGGTPLVEWVECLGVLGKADEIPLSLLVMKGWVAPVELIGFHRETTLLSLSFTAGGVTLAIGAMDRFDSTLNGLKESDECCWNIPSVFHGCPSVFSSKCED